MENLLIGILELTLPVSVLIAVLLLFSPLLKRAYVSKWRYYMWLFVSARLLLPLRPKLSAPLTVELPSGIMSVQQTAYFHSSLLQILTLIWLGGIAVLTVYHIICYISFRRMVNRWQENIADKTFLAEFEEAKSFALIKRDISAKRCKAVSTPMIFGIMKPVLLMPDVEFTKEELSIILRHELIHLKRCDILYKLLLVIVRTVYWFNPMVYLMSKAADKDLELACDAEVVKRGSAEYRYLYCEAIMRLVHTGRGVKTTLSTCFFFSKKTVMERFKYILDERIRRNGVIMFCAVAFSIAVSGGMVSFVTMHTAAEIEDKLHISEFLAEQPKEASIPDETEAPAAMPPVSESDISEHYIEDNSSEYRNNSGNTVSEYISDSAAPDYTAEETEPKAMSAENAVNSVPIGSERSSIYNRLGEPDTVSSDGSRETYSLSDGSTAVLQYDGEVLDSGYIVVN